MNHFINELNPRGARFVFWRRQTQISENVTLVTRLREHFHSFLVDVFGAELPPKKAVF